MEEAGADLIDYTKIRTNFVLIYYGGGFQNREELYFFGSIEVKIFFLVF